MAKVIVLSCNTRERRKLKKYIIFFFKILGRQILEANNRWCLAVFKWGRSHKRRLARGCTWCRCSVQKQFGSRGYNKRLVSKVSPNIERCLLHVWSNEQFAKCTQHFKPSDKIAWVQLQVEWTLVWFRV